MAMDEIQRWNRDNPKGTKVIWTQVGNDGGEETTTTSPAWLHSAGRPVVRVACYCQPVWLDGVKPVAEGAARMTLADLETYLLDTNGMERGQDPVARAIAIMETLAEALVERGVVPSLTPRRRDNR
jgi:hypothetical protein